MVEIDREIITTIGRRLREAAAVGQGGELPASIRLGLERLGGDANRQDADPRGPQREPEQETVEAAKPSVRPLL